MNMRDAMITHSTTNILDAILEFMFSVFGRIKERLHWQAHLYTEQQILATQILATQITHGKFNTAGSGIELSATGKS